MPQQKLLFIDRDGTLIVEPEDKQIDSLHKLALIPGVIPALLQLKAAGYTFVMVSNQDGLGTDSFPQDAFDPPHKMMLQILISQGITFENIHICPHKPTDNCDCRKPKPGLLIDYLVEQKIDRDHSWVIGDRKTDVQLAHNLGIRAIHFGQAEASTWAEVVRHILSKPRAAKVVRRTKETEVSVEVDLDSPDQIHVSTGIGFFDHMLEQLAKHGGFSLSLSVQGDLHIDEHHTVEDTAITLGEALRKALGDKLGIGRYGFLLPMDESLAHVALDLSGRAYFVFEGKFTRERVGDLATELVPHFFHSLCDTLKATLHVTVQGENTHHMIEGMFKGVGRTLRQAFLKVDESLPTTKGIL